MRPILSTVALTATLLIANPAAFADAGLGCGPGLVLPPPCFSCVAYVVSCVSDAGFSAETSDCPIGPGDEIVPCQIAVGDDDPIEGTCTYDHVTQDLDHGECVGTMTADNAACSWVVGDTTMEGVCADTCSIASADGADTPAPRRAVNWTAILMGIFLLFFVRRSLQVASPPER